MISYFYIVHFILYPNNFKKLYALTLSFDLPIFSNIYLQEHLTAEIIIKSKSQRCIFAVVADKRGLANNRLEF